MSYTTINKSTDYFNTKLYTGNGADNNSITGVGFQPDWVWLKARNQADYHYSIDAVRGVTKCLFQNSTDAESTFANSLKSFNSDGFTLGTSGDLNASSQTMASWNWKAGTGQGSSNTAGSINTTYTSVNTTAGFSISSYTGTGSNATIGHGLNAVPKMIIVKRLSGGTGEWGVYHASLGNTKALYLNGTSASSTETAFWNSTSPTSSVFSVGTANDTNGSGSTYIAYCFAEKTGYSKFGSYVGNGSSDGSFCYLGFKPAFLIIKRSSTGGDDWVMYDNKRNTFNVLDKRLNPNTNGAEQDTDMIDFVSNGFKLRGNPDYVNGNGSTYTYMCFAEAPLVGTNNVPCTAR